MLPWQWLHATIAVLDIRTIVECSPQFGQTDTSSYRCRQYTQRYRPGTAVGRSQGSPQLGHSGPSLTGWSLTQTEVNVVAGAVMCDIRPQ
jgi:hypothetical protein